MTFIEDEKTTGTTSISQKLTGYIGAFAILIGGVAMYLDLPYLGKLYCLNCPTGAGLIYLILAVGAFVFILTEKIRLLYIIGAGTLLVLLWDIYTSISMGNSPDAVLSGMTASSLPVSWIILVVGIILMFITPSIGKKKQVSIPDPKEEKIDERIQELNKIKMMYKNNNTDNDELNRIKAEYKKIKEKK